MKRLFQILLLLIPLFCCSQQSIVDSLERLLPSTTTDSARFRLLYQIGFSYRYINYDSALFYADKSLLVAQRNRKELNVAVALSAKGFILSRLQRLSEAFQVLTAALQIAEDPRNKNKFWNNLPPEIKYKDYRLWTLATLHNSLGFFMFSVDRTDQEAFHFNESVV